MKKTLLLGLLALASFSAKAQLAPGSQAPDFTATDINGVEHHLQGYLDAGKTVILDVSATWCGPCWGLHSRHVLEDLYYSYGPGGSDELVIIFIEGDATTGMDDLYGETATSQGDWVTGTPYPIIDSSTIASQYQIAYFPTLYKICPDGTVTEMSIVNEAGTAYETAATLLPTIEECADLTGAANYMTVGNSTVNLCEAGGTSGFEVEINNYGNNAISSFEIALLEDGTSVETMQIDETVNALSGGVLTFNEVAFNSTSEYTLQVTSVNNETPFENENTTSVVTVNSAAESENNLTILVHTDNYPTEITWNITDSNDNVLISGGPYEGNANGGGAEALTTITYNVNVPAGTEECYTVNMNDGYGDGWGYYTSSDAVPGIEIISNGNAVTYIEAGNFGAEIAHSAAFKTNGVLNREDIEMLNKFSIYPNPSTGVFNFVTEETVSISVMDLTGKVVYTAKEVNNDDVINLSNLQKGMYVAKIEGATSERTEKLVIK